MVGASKFGGGWSTDRITVMFLGKILYSLSVSLFTIERLKLVG